VYCFFSPCKSVGFKWKDKMLIKHYALSHSLLNGTKQFLHATPSRYFFYISNAFLYSSFALIENVRKLHSMCYNVLTKKTNTKSTNMTKFPLPPTACFFPMTHLLPKGQFRFADLHKKVLQCCYIFQFFLKTKNKNTSSTQERGSGPYKMFSRSISSKLKSNHHQDPFPLRRLYFRCMFIWTLQAVWLETVHPMTPGKVYW